MKESPLEKVERIKKPEISVDYFQFYKSVSTVYSSRIEGEEIDFDSYFKYKFLNIKFKADYTKKADDLYRAYDFIDNHDLNFDNVCEVHAILSSNLLPDNLRGKMRRNPMVVINSEDKIEYVAVESERIELELGKLFSDIALLLGVELDPWEIFYYSSLVHLVFVKTHPFQDGNGRTARLLEKWFLTNKIGDAAVMVQLEKNYYKNLKQYYSNIRKLGLEYDELDYSKSLDFLLMTVRGLDEQSK